MPMPRIDPEAFYGRQELAEILGVEVETLDRKRWTGGSEAIPFSKFGRRIWYRGADIIAVLDRMRRVSTSQPIAAAGDEDREARSSL